MQGVTFRLLRTGSCSLPAKSAPLKARECQGFLLSARGARVALVDVNQENLDAIVRAAKEAGNEIKPLIADLRTAQACRAAVGEAVGLVGTPQVFLHAVGGNVRKPVLELQDADWDETLTLNLSSAYWLGHAVGRLMVEERYGRMVFVSSVSGLLAHAHHAPYAAAKGGMNQMLRVMAREWAPHGVAVNAVAPGYIETDLTKSYLDKDNNRESLEALCAGRAAWPAGRGGRRGRVPRVGPRTLHHRPDPVRRWRPNSGLTALPPPTQAPPPAQEGHLMPLAPVPIPRRFDGRSVLVTGAGTGFGAEIAVRAAQEGARVVGIHYRSSVEGAKRTADRVTAEGSTPVLLQADIVDWEQIKAMADAAFERLEGIDVLVNNVGDVAREQMSWRDITEESIGHVLAVDIKGTMLCVHEFGVRMLDQGHGSIVNIGSTVIVRGSARAPQYAAAKYGILGVTKSYAHAFAPTVRVNVFAPGFIETEATLGRQDWQSGRGDQLRSLTPLGRIPGPAELAGTALFLASDDAAHMTGGYMVADGGYNMVGA